MISYAHIFEGLYECIFGRPRDEDVVWCDTGLTRINALAPQDTACRDLEVTFRVDNNGGLASKLERHWHQYVALKVWNYLETDRRKSLCSGYTYNPSYTPVPSVQD